jgi:hypothetical protein
MNNFENIVVKQSRNEAPIVDVRHRHSHTLKHYDPYDKKNIIAALPLLSELKTKGRNDGLLKGVVRTIQDGKLVDECIENIIVARGRRYVAQRLFGTRHPSDAPVYNWEISHFGLGSGGAVISGSTVNLMGPETCDLDLYEPLPQAGSPPITSYLTSPGDGIRGIAAEPYAAKPIEPSGSVDIIATEDIECEYGLTFSYVRCICVKSIGEPNYLPTDDDYIMINEACLYYTDSLINPNNASTALFAHICFPPKYVEKKSEFVVEWYILC